MVRQKCVAHMTSINGVIGNIDIFNNQIISGWYFHYDELKELKKRDIRIVIDEKEVEMNYGMDRKDVCQYYQDEEERFKRCGFVCSLPEKFDKLEIQYLDVEWKNLKSYEKPPLKINRNIPQLIVVDQFYENPDEVRDYALKQEFVTNIASHKGRRTTKDFNNDVIKMRFEELLGKPIIKWDYKWNGCFQYCIAEDPLVIHCDQQRYAAMVYLHPEAPCSTGTSFWRHKEIKCQYYRGNAFKNGNYDFTPFEEVDRIGNIYNRLVIFDAQMIHAASQYFGREMNDSRLFQIFFFDA